MAVIPKRREATAVLADDSGELVVRLATHLRLVVAILYVVPIGITDFDEVSVETFKDVAAIAVIQSSVRCVDGFDTAQAVVAQAQLAPLSIRDGDQHRC